MQYCIAIENYNSYSSIDRFSYPSSMGTTCAKLDISVSADRKITNDIQNVGAHAVLESIQKVNWQLVVSRNYLKEIRIMSFRSTSKFSFFISPGN